MQATPKTLKLLILLGVFVLSISPGRGLAQDSDMERLFTVTGIEVDVRSRTAAQARTIAINAAEEQGFRMLLRRLMGEADLDRFYLPEGAKPSDYVHGIEVVEERSSQVRYIATLNITFEAGKIEQLLGRQSIAYVGIAPKPALVIPLEWQDGAWLLWEEQNTFAGLWRGKLLENRIMAYRVLKGSVRERASITPDLLIQGRGKDRLQALAERYRVNEIIVIGARFFRNTSGEVDKLELAIHHPLSGAPGEAFDIYPTYLEPEEALLERGLGQFLMRRDQAWKNQSMTQFGSALELALIVPVAGEGSWAETLQKLSDTPVVQEVRIIRMAMPESYLVIRFAGTTGQLALALAQKGLILMESERGWVLISNEDRDNMIAGRGN
ncbi:MAG: DUF2066 domain-containing protein [Proteobacteria bacterium]|nr:DUF2066 domain-containing protein [Pseudomonadota bacterium]